MAKKKQKKRQQKHQQQQPQKQKKKQKNQEQRPLQPQNRTFDESARIRLSQILQNFLASKDEVYTFEADMSPEECVAVRQLSQKMGFACRGSGLAKRRKLSVRKIKQKVKTDTALESIPHFTFSRGSKQVLDDLFMHYPPVDEEFQSEMIQTISDTTTKSEQKKNSIFARPSMRKAEIANKLYDLTCGVKTKQIIKERSKLPIAPFKDVITSTVESHQVVLISGETGCGKTTQVPQFILDHMWGKGEVCKIVCTQPRRISAISVSERISSERGQTIGEDVGYKIRLESKGGRKSSIVLCTNGVLLRVLVSKGSSLLKTRSVEDNISGITHIIMDEIHERDRYSDLMLAILRDILPSYPHLHLILMSATIDAERFSQYFGGCPIICVPGFTYPVRTFYLEDILSMLKFREDKSRKNKSRKDNHLDNTSCSIPINNQRSNDEWELSLDEAINSAWSNDELEPLLELVCSDGTPKVFDYQHSLTGLTPLMVLAGKGKAGDMLMLLSLGANCHLKAKDGSTALEIAERENQQTAAEILKKHMGNDFNKEGKYFDTERENQQKAAEIQKQHMDNDFSSEEQKFFDTDGENQQTAAELLDKYLATANPELVDVVLLEQLIKKICIDSKDGGILVFLPGWEDINRIREKLVASPFFNDTSKFTVLPLHSMVPSKEQKKVFIRLPHGRRKIVLSTNIAETAVTINDIVYVIDTGRMKEKSYDPYNNVSTLQLSWVSKASAKQREGRAGRCQPGICYRLYSKTRAAYLPDFQVPEIRRMPIEELCLQVKLVDPSSKVETLLSKTLDPPVLESIHNAIVVLQEIGALSRDEELTELGQKLGSLPVHPSTSRMLFFAILMNCLDPALTLACASDYRDPFTLPMLPDEKKRATAARSELASLYGGYGDQFAVIAAYECWHNAKQMGLEEQFCLQYFLSPSTMHMLSGMRKKLQAELNRIGLIHGEDSSYNLNAHDPGILHAVLVAGLYPMVGKLCTTSKSGKRVIVETENGDKVRLNHHSMNIKLSSQKNFDRSLVVYDEITRVDMGLNIRNCTVVGPLPLLLLSREIAADSAEGGDKFMSSPDNIVRAILDRWLYFKSTALDVSQIYCLRERLSAAILYKVTNSMHVLPPLLRASVHAIACILSCDGLSGIPQTLDGVDTPATTENATNLGKPARGTEQVNCVDTPATTVNATDSGKTTMETEQIDCVDTPATTVNAPNLGKPGTGTDQMDCVDTPATAVNAANSGQTTARTEQIDCVDTPASSLNATNLGEPATGKEEMDCVDTPSTTVNAINSGKPAIGTEQIDCVDTPAATVKITNLGKPSAETEQMDCVDTPADMVNATNLGKPATGTELMDGVDTLASTVNATNLGKPMSGTEQMDCDGTPTATVTADNLGKPAVRTDQMGNDSEGSLTELINHDGRQAVVPSSKVSISASEEVENPSEPSSQNASLGSACSISNQNPLSHDFGSNRSPGQQAVKNSRKRRRESLSVCC